MDLIGSLLGIFINSTRNKIRTDQLQRLTVLKHTVLVFNKPFWVDEFNLTVDSRLPMASVRCLSKKTSTRRRIRIPWIVVEKITTRRREGGVVVVENNIKSRRIFN